MRNTGTVAAALRGLFRRPGRTLMTVGGIVIGVLTVVLVSLIGRMGADRVENELEDMGLSGVSISAEAGSTLTVEALSRIRAVGGVTDASPLSVVVTTAAMRDVSKAAAVCGIDAGATQVIALERLYGRLLSAADVRGAGAVCVVDEQVALDFYGRADVVGKTVTAQIDGTAVPLTVVGVTRTGSSILSTVSRFIPGMIYLPYTTLQAHTGSDAFDQIAVRTAGDDLAVRAAIVRTLERDGGRYIAEDLSSQRRKLSSLLDIVVWILTAVGGVSLAVSGLGVMNIMLVSVGERTREIGIKKALGAGQGRIRAEFLTEAVAVSVLGILLGTALGVAAGGIAAAVVGVPFSLPAGRLAAAAGITLLVGAASGLYPAEKAAALPPVEALKER